MDTRRDRRSNRQQMLQDVESAQLTAGVRLDGDGPGTLDLVEAELWHYVGELRAATADARTTEAAVRKSRKSGTGLQGAQTAAADRRRELTEIRRSARTARALLDGLTSVAKERARSELDTAPDCIELIGVENMRAQLTQSLQTTPH